MLPDHLEPDLSLVLVGTVVGEQSATRGHYYAGHGNSSWKFLHEAALTPTRLEPLDDATLPRYGIGLTDLAKSIGSLTTATCRMTSGVHTQDRALPTASRRLHQQGGGQSLRKVRQAAREGPRTPGSDHRWPDGLCIAVPLRSEPEANRSPAHCVVAAAKRLGETH